MGVLVEERLDVSTEGLSLQILLTRVPDQSCHWTGLFVQMCRDCVHMSLNVHLHMSVVVGALGANADPRCLGLIACGSERRNFGR
eukprot:8224392-Pyramimonas_sp.AAC.1